MLDGANGKTDLTDHPSSVQFFYLGLVLHRITYGSMITKFHPMRCVRTSHHPFQEEIVVPKKQPSARGMRLRLLMYASGVVLGLMLLMMFSLGGRGLLSSVSAEPLGKSTIGNYVWYDKNVDGYHETTGDEAEFLWGIDGVTVTLWIDSDGDGKLDPNVDVPTDTITTGDNPGTSDVVEKGWYQFNVTAAGSKYIVAIEPENFAPGGPLEGMQFTSGDSFGGAIAPGGRITMPVQFADDELIAQRTEVDFGFVKTDITLVKVANNAPDGDTEYIPSGQTVYYTYTFTNTGDAALTNLVLYDDNGTPSDPSDDFEVCSVAGPLAAGASDSCTHQASNVTANVLNTAVITGTPVMDDGSTPILYSQQVTATDDADVVVVHPNIEVSKTPDLQYLLSGGTAQFTIFITNTGDVRLEPIVTEDPLVADCVRGAADGLALDPGDSTQFTCSDTNVTADYINVITATGTPADANGNPLPDISPVQASDDAQVDVVAPAIAISKTPDLQYLLDSDDATFTITITNTGDTPLSNITLDDPLTAGCENYTGADPLAVGAHETWTCTRDAADFNDDFTNVITVTATPSDDQGNALPGIPNVQASDDAVVDVVNPSIEVSKTPDIQYLLSGETAYFTITITNTGDVRLYPVTTEDPLATNCELGNITLEPGASTEFTCFKENITADFTNVITVTGQPVDNTNQPLPGIGPVSASDDADVDVMAPEIALTKVLNTPSPVRLYDPISYTIRITNTGDGWVTVLPLTDTYDTTYLSFQNASTSPDDGTDDGQLDWSDVTDALGDLQPGASVMITLTFKANGDTTSLSPDGKTPNTAIVDGAKVDPDGPSGPEGPILPVDRVEDEARVEIIKPTNVEMASGQALAMGTEVLIRWSTVDESNILGFNILRRDGWSSFQQVNQDLIFAHHPGAALAGAYTFVDGQAPLGLSFYALEIVRLDGHVDRVPLGRALVRPWIGKGW